MGALSIASFLNSIFAVRFSLFKATRMSKRFVQSDFEIFQQCGLYGTYGPPLKALQFSREHG